MNQGEVGDDIYNSAKRKRFSEICILKTFGVRRRLAGKFNLLHTHRTLALDWEQTHTHTRTDRQSTVTLVHMHAER